jgi:hypothetical protein
MNNLICSPEQSDKVFPEEKKTWQSFISCVRVSSGALLAVTKKKIAMRHGERGVGDLKFRLDFPACFVVL